MALSVRQVARVRYGIRCVVTYRIIEALGRVEFGGEFGITPDHIASKVVRCERIPSVLSFLDSRSLALFHSARHLASGLSGLVHVEALEIPRLPSADMLSLQLVATDWNNVSHSIAVKDNFLCVNSRQR